MDSFLGKYSPYLYAILRIVSGLLYAMHGSQKLFGWPGDKPAVELVSLMGLAGIIELVGGLLIMIGLLTTWAAFIASGQMAAAYFIAHAPQAALPLLNGGELAVIYCFLFLYIASKGAGIWSVDGARRTHPVTALHT
ncbi:DoxX family protein [Pontibacter saemangeumensis]|uniref:DoxX family protein n=1 Tax=Pontibacter saemangeumensis TaxID=1084525 RepID=A0ABP8LAI1_9BACT